MEILGVVFVREKDESSGSESISMLPLCVDLDGTLIRSDLLVQSRRLLIERRPLSLFPILLWRLRGNAVLKSKLADRVALDPAALPYDNELIDWLWSERGAGRQLWLCTGANERFAWSIANHLRLFDGVLASDSRLNLVGAMKASRLVQRFGEHGFDYCGNEEVDLLVWKHARAAIVVNGSDELTLQASRVTRVVRTFPRRG